MRALSILPTFAYWKRAARRALHENVPPSEIAWEELDHDQPSLGVFDEADELGAGTHGSIRVPKSFIQLADRVACHRDPQRWALLYRVLWRLTHDEPNLLEILVDPDVHALAQMDKAIRHDVHKMRAFVRFRAVSHEGETWYVAWFEPQHHIVERNAPFFVDRFASMQWSILTPDRCAHWDGKSLSFTGGLEKTAAPASDGIESLWINYYSYIFNPARVKEKAMLAEMPKQYWKNLPEATVIPALLREAPQRMKKMLVTSAARKSDPVEHHPAPVPATDDWNKVRASALRCTACPLFRNATQTVFGEGPMQAEVMFVGEQPGDREDVEGQPFVGPSGKLLDRALGEAGIDRSRAYVTNAVKHFKWELRGKRRLHQTPNSRDIAACRPWLEAELRIIQPKVLVCLGGTAAKTIFGPSARILRDRGKIVESPFCTRTMITVHPSSLLRAPDEAAREENYALFLNDLRMAARQLRDV